jgi:hypothetical protein
LDPEGSFGAITDRCRHLALGHAHWETDLAVDDGGSADPSKYALPMPATFGGGSTSQLASYRLRPKRKRPSIPCLGVPVQRA